MDPKDAAYKKELKRYVKENIKRGFDLEAIKNKVLQSGARSDLIDEVFRDIEIQAKRAGRKLVLPSVLAILLVSGLLFLYSKNIQYKPICPSDGLRILGTWKGEGQREEFIAKLISNFQESNEDVCFRFPQDIGLQDYGSEAKNIADMIKRNQFDWDVIHVDAALYFMVSKLLNDMAWGEKYLITIDEVDIQGSHKQLLTNSQINDLTGGVHIGPYIEGNYFLLYYNMGVANELGIKIESQVSFDDIRDYYTKLKKFNQDNNRDLRLFSATNGATLINFLFLDDDKFSDMFEPHRPEDFLSFKDSHDQEIMLETDAIGYHDDFSETYSAFMRGESLFYFDLSAYYNTFEQLSPQEIGKISSALPPRIVAFYTPVFAAFKNAENSERAYDFLKYLSKSTIGELWMNYTKNPTGLKTDALHNSFLLSPLQNEIDDSKTILLT